MFFQNFWHHFAFDNMNKTNKLIDENKNLNIEQILEEENVIQDLKQNSQKFSKYLMKNTAQLKQLIDYCLQETDVTTCDGQDYKKGLKYPFVASEIFSTSPQNLAEYLFGEYKFKEEEEEEDQNQNKSASIQDEEEQAENDKVQDDDEDDDEHKKSATEDAAKDKPDIDEEQQNNNDKDQEPMDEDETEVKNSNNTDKITFTPEQLLSTIFKFLDRDDKSEHFSTSAGYFAKIITMLSSKENLLWKYLNENPEILKNFLKHIDNRSVAEILQKLIQPEMEMRFRFYDNDYKNDEANNDEFIDSKKNLISDLFQHLSQSEDQETIENICSILQTIIGSSNASSPYGGEYSAPKTTPLGEHTYQPEHIEILLKKLTNEDSFIVSYCSNVLIDITDIISNKENGQQQQSNMEDDDQVNIGEDNCFDNHIQMFVDNYDSLIKVLRDDPEVDSHPTQFGTQAKPFGIGRLNLMKLVAQLIKLKNEDIYNKMIQNDLFTLAFKFFNENEWNNVLHLRIEKIVENTLNTENETLIQNLLDKSDIAQVILKGSKKDDTSKDEEQPNRGQPGNMSNYINLGRVGFLTKFANMLEDKKTQFTRIRVYLENNEQWDNWVKNSLKTTNELEKDRKLGGDKDTNDSDDDNKEELDIDIQRIYEKFHQYFQANKPAENEGDKDDELQKEQVEEDFEHHQNDDGDNNNQNNEQQKEDDQNEHQDDQQEEQEEEEEQFTRAKGNSYSDKMKYHNENTSEDWMQQDMNNHNDYSSAFVINNNNKK